MKSIILKNYIIVKVILLLLFTSSTTFSQNLYYPTKDEWQKVTIKDANFDEGLYNLP